MAITPGNFTIVGSSIVSIYGDSLTEQCALDGIRRFILAKYAANPGIVFSDGLSGDTMANGQGRVNSVVGGRRPRTTKIAIEYGTNDFVASGGGLAAFTTNTGLMITNCGVAGVTPGNLIFIGIMGGSTSNQADVTNYNNIIIAAANANGAFYVDMQSPYRALIALGFDCTDGGGGVHPQDTIQTFPDVYFTDAYTGAINQKLSGGTMSGKQWYTNAAMRNWAFN
jgi:hypothetical protein